MSSSEFKSRSLFITMQYLRTVNNVRKYHWALFNAGEDAPKGYLLHATDTGRQALDLRLEVREVRNPRSSKSMVACLRVGNSPGIKVLKACADAIPLMDVSSLPRNEPQWTCRVWVKNMLYSLGQFKYLRLPSDLDSIELLCQQAADLNIGCMGRARVFNDLSWMTLQPPTTPMDTAPDRADARYYGSKPMMLDSTMTASSGSGGRQTMQYYGTKPMAVDWRGSSYY